MSSSGNTRVDVVHIAWVSFSLVAKPLGIEFWRCRQFFIAIHIWMKPYLPISFMIEVAEVVALPNARFYKVIKKGGQCINAPKTLGRQN